MDKNENKQQLTEVWGDTVSLKELIFSTVIGIALTMVFYLIGRVIFNSIGTIEKSLANGYSLLVGIFGCFVAAVISAKCFKPKRIIEEKADPASLEEILHDAGMTIEDEIEALSVLDPGIIKEMEDVGLYSLLALIPEGSPNYKAEYKELNKENSTEKNIKKEV
jgi:hypothetical protein